jgi:uncharacterized glyoxalase superfamily protein PhnB
MICRRCLSLFVDCDSEQRLDEAFAELSGAGTILMPLQAYPSWQLNLATVGATG